MRSVSISAKAWILFVALAVLTIAIYRPGLDGTYLFDDFPNIVDNPGVKPADASLPSLARVALSSPSSEFKRPLASLSFGANYLVSGNDPFGMKVTNLVIHVLNGWLVFLIARIILRIIVDRKGNAGATQGDLSAALIAGAWLLLPINLTAVLYVVQRMESLANLFVLLGLLGYLKSRLAMQVSFRRRKYIAAAASLVLPTALGAMAKETAVMLPMYAFVAECMLFGSRSISRVPGTKLQRDYSIHLLFLVVLWLPMLLGLIWLLPGLLQPSGWSTRDFTMQTRLLTEARVVLDYIAWTLVPTPEALSFYHDDLVISRSLLTPWTTLPSIVGVLALMGAGWLARHKMPVITLGIGFYLACHLLTGTILPLELVYEHRNYFASFGLLLAFVPTLAQPTEFVDPTWGTRLKTVGRVALIAVLVMWTGITAMTSYAWGNPLRLSRELAERSPTSPRAQYELGRTYIILSSYDPASPFANMAYAPLERAAALPGSGILPEQALIFLNSRLHRPIKPEWWEAMERKLMKNKVTVQDESALASLVQCDRSKQCDLPAAALTRLFIAAVSHPERSARLLANYGDFAWNQLNDRTLGTRLLQEAVRDKPNESAYRITLLRMYVVQGRIDDARSQRNALSAMNVGGALNSDLATVDKILGE